MHSILLAISFIGTCLVVNQTLTLPFWRPDVGEINSKLSAFEAVSQDFDILVIGSSHLDYGVNPIILDEELRANGIELRTFNLAFEGMTVAEREFMLEKSLGLSNGKAKYVIVEFELRATPLIANLLSARTRFFSSPKYIKSSFDTKYYSNRNLSRRLAACGVIMTSGLVNQLNLGVLSEILLPDVQEALHSSDAKNDFSPVGWKNGDVRLAKRNIASITSGIARASKAIPTNRELTDAEFAPIFQDVKTIEDAGCVPIIVFPPSCKGLDEDHSIRNSIMAKRPDLFVLDFTAGSPEWQEFCDAELWFDPGHLAKGGADELSRLLGSRICSKIQN